MCFVDMSVFLRNYVEKAKGALAGQEITTTLWKLAAHYIFTGACQLFIPSARRMYKTSLLMQKRGNFCVETRR